MFFSAPPKKDAKYWLKKYHNELDKKDFNPEKLDKYRDKITTALQNQEIEAKEEIKNNIITKTMYHASRFNNKFRAFLINLLSWLTTKNKEEHPFNDLFVACYQIKDPDQIKGSGQLKGSGNQIKGPDQLNGFLTSDEIKIILTELDQIKPDIPATRYFNKIIFIPYFQFLKYVNSSEYLKNIQNTPFKDIINIFILTEQDIKDVNYYDPVIN